MLVFIRDSHDGMLSKKKHSIKNQLHQELKCSAKFKWQKKKISAKLGSFCLRNKIKIKIVNATPSNCKNNLKHSDTYSQNRILLDHHLIKPNS